ncbi:platelet glycoprotein Ib alpha chain [Notamacropus eugenii]|uniref:platelet glycoprotein Ib alpha chain n=1 Tax=Notamacropus eugenii TaxID=9315 RepID=UPI003B674556
MNLKSSWEMDPRLLLLLLLLLLLGRSYSQTPCETHKVGSKLETNCESLGLKSVPSKLPPDTNILFLQNNALKSFLTSSLSLLTQLTELNLAKNNMSILVADGKLPLLSNLDLSDNDLKTLPQLGHFLPSLTLLDLSRNALESLSPEALTGLDFLENLYLQDNKLRSLPPNFLKATPKLQKLNLANNYLEHLSADLLKGLENLNTLFLQNNQLSVLPVGFFGDHLLPYVFLHSNPWNCDCELRYLRHWLQENQGNVYVWKEGVDVKVMTPNVRSVECKIPSRTPVYTFSANCPVIGDYDYDSYDGYDGVTMTGFLDHKLTTISLEHSTVLSSSERTMTELITSPITSFPDTQTSTIFLNSPETSGFPLMPELTKFLISSEATTLQTTPEPITFSENLETSFPASLETTIFPVTLEKSTSPNTQSSTIFLNSPETTFPTMPELAKFLISSEATTFQITPKPTAFSKNLETRFPTSLEATTFPVTLEKSTSPNTQRSTIFLNSPETTVFSTMPELAKFLISSEATTVQTTPEPITFSENLETTRFPTSLEATTFPVTSEETMLQSTPELVPSPSTNSTAHISSTPVSFPSLSSTLTLMKSNILPPNEAVALESLGDPSDSSSPLSISCCLLSLRFYIFGIAWVLVSSIVLILLLALAQPPPHLPRTHAFMEHIPKPWATVHLEFLKGKEVIIPRAYLLSLEGLIPSFRTRLFLWVRSNGRVGPLTLKRKPSAISLGRGEDLLGSVNIRYSGHSL